MKRWLPIVVLALCAVWLPLLFSAEPEPTALPSVDEPVERDDAQPAQAGAPAAEPAPVIDEPPQPEPAIEPPPTPVAPPEVEAALTGPVLRMKTRFEEETRDSLWANDAEPLLASFYELDSLPANSVTSVECHRTVCVLEVQFQHGDHWLYVPVYKQMRETFGEDITFRPLATTPDPETGLVPVQVYVLRKGYSLKDLKD